MRSCPLWLLGIDMNTNNNEEIISILREIRDGQKQHLERQAESLAHEAESMAMQREQFAAYKNQMQGVNKMQERAQQIQEKAAQLVGASRKVFVVVIPFALLMLIYASWILFRGYL